MSEVVNIRQEVDGLVASLPTGAIALTCQCMFYPHNGKIETMWQAYHSNVPGTGGGKTTIGFPTVAEAAGALRALFSSPASPDETIVVQEPAATV